MPQIYKSPQEALEKAIKIWEVLASGKAVYKEDAYDLLSFQRDKGYCPCCQYDTQLSNSLYYCCDNCPVKDWGEGESRCLLHKSSYSKWLNADYIDRAYRAKAVVATLKQALDYHNQKGASNGKPEN